MNKIKINLIVAIIGQFIAIIYGFILPRLILEQFGSEVNGLIQSITQFLGIINFLDMGVGQIVRSALYKPLEKNDCNQLSRILVSGRKFYRRIAYALLLYVAIMVVVYPIRVDKYFDWPFTAVMIVIISIGSFAQYYFGVTQEQLLHASQKSYLICSVQILCYLFNLGACVILIRMNCSIHVVKLATAIIFLIKPLFYTWYIRHQYDINWNISYVGEPLQQKWHGIAQHISAVILDGTDNIVLTLFSTLSNVSIYSVYYMVISSIQGFYQSAVMGIQSAAGAMWAKQDPKGIRQLFSITEGCLHMVTVFLFSCAGILILPFVRVYTDGLTDANYLQPTFATILTLAYGIRCLRTPYNIWILAAGHFKQTKYCHVAAAILNLLISIMAVSKWGLIGVAIGTLIAMCYQTVWMAVYTIRSLVKCSVVHIIKRFVVDILMIATICISTCWIVLEDISYISWFVMALKVSVISAMCVIVISFAFYRSECMVLVRRIWRKK